MKKLLTAIDVAEILNCSVKTIRRTWKRGGMPAPVRVGRRGQRWRTEDIERYIDENSAKVEA